MSTLLLTVLYLASAAVLAALVHRAGGRPSWWAVAVLSLLPLAFTAGGWLPGKVLAPTVSLAGVPPWTHPDLAQPILDGSTAPNPLLADPLSQMEPWRQAARHDLLFDPSAAGGAALLGNGQSAALFPVEIAARALAPVRATTYVQAARLLLAAWGLFLLARSLGLSEIAALLGALVYTGSGFLQLWRLHPHSYVAALAPWILWALLRLVRRPGPRSAAVLALVGALGVFGGHPETLVHTALLGLLWVLPALPFVRRRWAVVRWGVVAAGLAFLLAAPALLPFLDNLPVASEWVHRRDQAPQPASLPLDEALPRLWPAIDLRHFGDPVSGDWWGPENLAELAGGATSLAALLLLPAALIGRRHRRRVAGLLLLGAIGLAVSVHLPGISSAFAALPLLGTSLLKRLSLWWALALAVAAGAGIDHLLRARGWRHRWLRRAPALTALVLAPVVAVSVSATAGGRSLPDLALLALPLLLVPALAPLLHRRGLAGGLAVSLLALCLLLPPAALYGRWVPLSAADSFYPTTPAIEFIRERAAGYRVAGIDSALVPTSAAFFGLEDVRPNDPMTFAPYGDFVQIFSRPERGSWPRIATWSHPALDLLGVRFLFDHPTMYVFHHPGIDQIWEGEDALIYENPRAFERIFRPAEVEVFAEPAAALAATRQITDFAQRATATGPGLPPPGVYPNGGAAVSGVEVHGRRLSARVEAAMPALIATSQPAIPGWHARVDGEAAETVRVDGAFLGVLVGPGEHRLEWVYAPASWRWGLGACALGTLAWAALMVPWTRAAGKGRNAIT